MKRAEMSEHPQEERREGTLQNASRILLVSTEMIYHHGRPSRLASAFAIRIIIRMIIFGRTAAPVIQQTP